MHLMGEEHNRQDAVSRLDVSLQQQKETYKLTTRQQLDSTHICRVLASESQLEWFVVDRKTLHHFKPLLGRLILNLFGAELIFWAFEMTFTNHFTARSCVSHFVRTWKKNWTHIAECELWSVNLFPKNHKFNFADMFCSCRNITFVCKVNEAAEMFYVCAVKIYAWRHRTV